MDTDLMDTTEEDQVSAQPFPHVPARGVPIWMEQQAQSDELPAVLPYGGMRPPEGPVPISQAADFVQAATALMRQQESERKAALTYQRQMKYTQMVQQGVDPAKALWDSGLWMNYTHPGPMQGIAKAMTPPPVTGQTLMATPVYDQDGNVIGNTIDVGGKPIFRAIPKPPTVKSASTTPLHEQLRSINTELGKAQARLLSGTAKDQQEADTLAIQQLEDRREQVENALKSAGEQVVISPRTDIRMTPKVLTPPDLRSPMQRILPNFLGGSPAPQPVTNLVPTMGVAPVAPAMPVTPTIVHPDPTNTVPTPLLQPPELSAPQALAPKTEEIRRVRVKSPKGKIGWIPEYQLDQALAEGYTPVD